MCFCVYIDNIQRTVSKQRSELFCSDVHEFPDSGHRSGRVIFHYNGRRHITIRFDAPALDSSIQNNFGGHL